LSRLTALEGGHHDGFDVRQVDVDQTVRVLPREMKSSRVASVVPIVLQPPILVLAALEAPFRANTPPARRMLLNHLAVLLPEVRTHVVNSSVKRNYGDPLVRRWLKVAGDGGIKKRSAEVSIPLGEVEMLSGLLIPYTRSDSARKELLGVSGQHVVEVNRVRSRVQDMKLEVRIGIALIQTVKQPIQLSLVVVSSVLNEQPEMHSVPPDSQPDLLSQRFVPGDLSEPPAQLTRIGRHIDCHDLPPDAATYYSIVH
jgi:hypothetical protein